MIQALKPTFSANLDLDLAKDNDFELVMQQNETVYKACTFNDQVFLIHFFGRT